MGVRSKLETAGDADDTSLGESLPAIVADRLCGASIAARILTGGAPGGTHGIRMSNYEEEEEEGVDEVDEDDEDEGPDDLDEDTDMDDDDCDEFDDDDEDDDADADLTLAITHWGEGE